MRKSAHLLHSDLLLLAGLSLLVRLLTAWPMRVPGYMDAYYYFIGASRLAQGLGLTEPYLWNYLGTPLTLPAPAFTYWLPLTSWLMAPFLALFGNTFRAGQAPFILLSSLLPLLAYLGSRQLSPERRHAWLAALLTLFSPFVLKFAVSTDTFTPFAVLGSLTLLLGIRAAAGGPLGLYPLAGVLAGLAGLTRADAPLLLVAIGLVALWPGEGARPIPFRIGRVACGLLLAGLAYLIVLAPWQAHIYAITGTPSGAGGLRTALLRSYDDLFAYERLPSLTNYLAWGSDAILRSKLVAAGSNLLTILGVFLAFFLAPFAGWELWARRRQTFARLAGVYLLLLFLTMTLIFTFPGPRGSLLHSGGALLPLLLPLAVIGLERAIQWAARRRTSWDAPQASRVFGAGAVGLCIVFSGLLYAQAIWAGGDISAAWNTHDDLYRVAGEWLDAAGVPREAPVLVINPPAFHYFTNRPTLALPNDPPEALAELCRRFGASHALLEPNRPAPLNGLYESDGLAGLRLERAWEAAPLEGKLYRCPNR